MFAYTPLGPALSSGPIHTPGLTAGGGAHGKGKILCVCGQARCRPRAFLAFPLLVQCCCGCISLAGPLPAELDRQKLCGKEDGVFLGHMHPHSPPNSCAAVRKSSPDWDPISSQASFRVRGPHWRELGRATVYCGVRISLRYLLSSLFPKLFLKCGHNPFHSGLPGGHVSLRWALILMLEYLMMVLTAQRSQILLHCFLGRTR